MGYASRDSCFNQVSYAARKIGFEELKHLYWHAPRNSSSNDSGCTTRGTTTYLENSNTTTYSDNPNTTTYSVATIDPDTIKTGLIVAIFKGRLLKTPVFNLIRFLFYVNSLIIFHMHFFI